MATEEEVEQFLKDFFVKWEIFEILFIDRVSNKNSETLLKLDISPARRREILKSLTVKNFVQGPIEDLLYKISDLWVFGYTHNKIDLYIKISHGRPNSSVLCISFHVAEHKLVYHFK